MFNIRVTFNVDPLAHFRQMTDFLRRADDELYASAADAYALTTPPTLDVLQEIAPPVDYPLDWTSLAQKRAVVRKLRAQGNLPYRRTGAYSRNWSIALLRAQGYTRIALANPAPYAVWVGGDVNPQRAGRGQQRMHRKTGWQPAAPVVTQWANETIALTVTNFRIRMARMARVNGQQVVYE